MWQINSNMSWVQARTSQLHWETEETKHSKHLNVISFQTEILIWLCRLQKYLTYMHIYIKWYNIKPKLLYMCFSIFLPFCTFLVIVCVLSSNHLKFTVNIFIHNALHLSEISLRGKNILTVTVALKSIDSDGHFIPSFSFNHSSKHICLFLFLHNRLEQSENGDYPLTHFIFL